MITEVKEFFQEFFRLIWSIFEAVTIPGTNITAANVLIGVVGVSVIMVFINKSMNAGAINIGTGHYQAYMKSGSKSDAPDPEEGD